MRNLIDILDFTIDEIDELIATASDMIESPEKYSEVCRGKILGTLFFEPSTRTRLSFTSAMTFATGKQPSWAPLVLWKERAGRGRKGRPCLLCCSAALPAL